MALRIRLTPRALDDLERIKSYLLQHSARGADSVRTDIRRTVRTIARHPGIGRPMDIDGLRRTTTVRYAYVVYYAVRDPNLVVVHVRHGSRAAPGAEELT